MARGHESDDERDARSGSAARHSSSRNDDALSAADEEAIRAKLRESGWEKKKRAGKDGADESAASPMRKPSDEPRERRSRDERAREKDRESRRRGSDSHRSRSHRRDRDDRRDRESRRSRRDRSAKRGKPSSRRHSSRSRSVSKSRSASRSRYSRRRGASRSRSVSKGREKKGTSRRHTASKSRSTSPRQRTTDGAKSEVRATASEDVEMTSSASGGKGEDDSAMDVDVPVEPTDGDKSSDDKDAPRKSDRAPRKSSRRSRSKSRSPSRSSRRRRHRSSRSRSPSRSRRRRGSSRSASRSRGRRSTGGSSSSRRRRRSSRSRSRSASHRRRRRSSSPAPVPPTAPAAAVPTVMAPFAAPLPAATPSVNPSITQLMQQHPTLSLQEIIAKMQASTMSMAAAAAQKPARELYIGNLPTNVTGPQLQEYLSTIIQQVGLTTQPGSPIVNTWLSVDGHFAFCEMRSIDECTLALLLNGLVLLGQPLKFGRPRSYTGPPQPYPTISATAQAALASLGCAPSPMWFTTTSALSSLSGVPPLPLPPQHVVAGAVPPPMPSSAFVGSSVAAAPAATPVALPTPIPATVLSALPADGSMKRLLMSNIPVVLVESQVRELVEPFGSLASFQLITDSATGASTGNAVFEYETVSAAADALEGLHGLDIGGIPLTVRRASDAVEEPSDVLKLANMVALEELANDDEFADLKEDVEEECKRFGSVVDLVIPRPQDGASVPGVGNIYVRFSQQAEAAAALKALSGRKFGGNVVQVSYYPVAKLERKDFA